MAQGTHCRDQGVVLENCQQTPEANHLDFTCTGKNLEEQSKNIDLLPPLVSKNIQGDFAKKLVMSRMEDGKEKKKVWRPKNSVVVRIDEDFEIKGEKMCKNAKIPESVKNNPSRDPEEETMRKIRIPISNVGNVSFDDMNDSLQKTICMEYVKSFSQRVISDAQRKSVSPKYNVKLAPVAHRQSTYDLSLPSTPKLGIMNPSRKATRNDVGIRHHSKSMSFPPFVVHDQARLKPLLGDIIASKDLNAEIEKDELRKTLKTDKLNHFCKIE
ncbi:predicted protein [Nematostella vectensis]|uniref:Uncharacterized protein n=1 Tax=Nematostella vectensis TaxID=45351 RepID=A7SHK4_NEMVE|nr:predicted protein [Nematostella vectensis]|eukprot:XP_001628856.1 predicted protein [Nematostella vectensis]